MEILWKKCLLIIGCSLLLISCSDTTTLKEQNVKDTSMTSYGLKDSLVIAHRGTTYWAPEETEAAMRWARNMGADYLEFDLQRSKDGLLIALHDEQLLRTTDVALKFPERKEQPLSAFTYAELLSLDAGLWFNNSIPAQARPAFEGLDLLTLQDVIQIAEGKRIKRDAEGKRVLQKNEDGTVSSLYELDPADNGHRPGIYVETKVPALFPGIEEDLKSELIRLGWYHTDVDKLKPIPTLDGHVAVANTPQRVILQTFSKESLAKLHTVFERSLPTCFLLWRGAGADDLPDDQEDTFKAWVDYGQKHGASIIGPSIAGAPNDYVDLLSPQQAKIIHDKGMLVHAYSFDSEDQMDKYHSYVDGMFTNRSDLSLVFYGRNNSKSSAEILKDLGY